jgi:hypothetical protein
MAELPSLFEALKPPADKHQGQSPETVWQVVPKLIAPSFIGRNSIPPDFWIVSFELPVCFREFSVLLRAHFS